MKLLHYAKDGGKDSTVWGFWLVEWKRLFSVALLCFENGSRDAYHSHAFNSVSVVLKGELEEDVRFEDGKGFTQHYGTGCIVRTPRACMHKVTSRGRTWVLTFRGPWAKTWREWLPNEDRFVTLASGRREVPTVEELQRSRAEMFAQRGRTLPIRWFNV